jgi:hypothetical protein
MITNDNCGDSKWIRDGSEGGPLDVYVGPQIGMNPKPILGLPNLEINLGSPRSDMGIPVPIWGPRFECRSSLGTKPLRPKLERTPNRFWLVTEQSPNLFGDPRFGMGMY